MTRTFVFPKRAWLIGACIALSGALMPGSAHPQQAGAPAQAATPSKDDSAKKSKPKKLDPNFSGFERLEADKIREERSVVGGTRGLTLASPKALAPHLGKYYGASPLFAWSYPGKYANFSLAITNDDGAELFRVEVDGASTYHLAADAVHFQPGQVYAWTVETLQTSMASQPSDPVRFTVVDDTERAKIDDELKKIPAGDSYESAMARAKVFIDHRLWYDAVGALDEVIAAHPGQPKPYELRGKIYEQVDATASLADDDLRHAKELRGTK
jgi:hypothetical protein